MKAQTSTEQKIKLEKCVKERILLKYEIMAKTDYHKLKP